MTAGRTIMALCVLLASSSASTEVLAQDSVQKTKSESSSKQASSDNKKQNQTKNSIIADGFYHVIRFSKNKSEVLPVHEDEKLVEYDYHLLQEDEREPVEYEVIEYKSFVPIILDGDPQKEKDNKGRPNLLIKLSESQIKPLEEFTSKHLGSRVAIVIGNQIVTMHKIREAITGGKIQISRCSDHGCEVIYTQLQKDKK